MRPAKPLALEPDPALAELLDAIRHGGRDAYRRLLEILRELKTLEPGDSLYKQALAELARAQGVVLGNVGVYVDASVDPETLTHSKAALAQALVRQGLVAEATRGGGDGLPLLRGVTAQTIAGVAADEQVIVFADRVRCLRQLAAHPARAPRRRSPRRRRRAHAAPSSTRSSSASAPASSPSCACRGSGTRATTSRTPPCSCTSTCRGCRPGSSSASAAPPGPAPPAAAVQTYIPYIKDAGIAHVVSVLSPRGGEHHQILDSFEGVAAADSTVASQLGEITSQIADDKDQAGYAGTAARLRVAAAVFGAA